MSTDPVRRINLGAVRCEPRPQLPDGFRRNSTRVGTTLGAARTGLSVYELPPRPGCQPLPLRRTRRGMAPGRLRHANAAPSGRRGAARTVGPRLLSRRSRRCTPRAEQQRVNRPRRDVLVLNRNGRRRRLPGQRHDLGLDSRRRSRHHRETKQRRGRCSALDCWRKQRRRPDVALERSTLSGWTLTRFAPRMRHSITVTSSRSSR